MTINLKRTDWSENQLASIASRTAGEIDPGGSGEFSLLLNFSGQAAAPDIVSGLWTANLGQLITLAEDPQRTRLWFKPGFSGSVPFVAGVLSRGSFDVDGNISAAYALVIFWDPSSGGRQTQLVRFQPGDQPLVFFQDAATPVDLTELVGLRLYVRDNPNGAGVQVYGERNIAGAGWTAVANLVDDQAGNLEGQVLPWGIFGGVAGGTGQPGDQILLDGFLGDNELPPVDPPGSAFPFVDDFEGPGWTA